VKTARNVVLRTLSAAADRYIRRLEL